MIKISILSGPYIGRVREIPKGMDPNEILPGISNQGWKYQIDYSQATIQEIESWGAAEMMDRILSALHNGLPVVFDGETYLLECKNILVVGQEIEDAISSSGKLVYIKSDDESGLVIEAFKPH